MENEREDNYQPAIGPRCVLSYGIYVALYLFISASALEDKIWTLISFSVYGMTIFYLSTFCLSVFACSVRKESLLNITFITTGIVHFIPFTLFRAGFFIYYLISNRFLENLGFRILFFVELFYPLLFLIGIVFIQCFGSNTEIAPAPRAQPRIAFSLPFPQITKADCPQLKVFPSEKLPPETFCSICRDETSKATWTQLSCGHFFHKECYCKWGKECPLCRQVHLMV